MSLENKEIIKCPECGKENDFIVWQSLNTEINPEAKEQLLNGTLFRFKCADCGYESNVTYPILYHDMSNRLMIYFVKEDEIDEIKKTFEPDSQFGFAMEGYKRRIVTDQNSLREKAIIFDNGLDDRVVEIIKLMYFANLRRSNPEAKVEVAYFIVDNGEYQIHFLGETPLVAKLEASFYENIARDFASKIESSEDDYIVDMKWAIKLLSSK